MIKVIALLLTSILPFSANAEKYVYESLGQPSIGIDMENEVFMIGDAEGQLKSCELNGLELCLQIGKTFIVIPDNHKAPLKIQLSGTSELVFLPIMKSMSVLGSNIEGFEVSIHNVKDRTLESSLFFNSEYGLLMFSFDGNIYWSASARGLASRAKD